jgi:CTP synthase
VEPKYIAQLEAAGMVFSGRHPKQPIMQIMELPRHPYFIAGQYHPELTSRPLHPQPLFMGLIAAAVRRKYADSALSRDAEIARWIRPADGGTAAAPVLDPAEYGTTRGVRTATALA